MTEPARALNGGGADEWLPAHNPWIIALTVTLSTFMEVLDTSIANVALPHIAGSLSATIDESTWVLTSYLVSNAIILPLTGWFSTLFGRKRFYMSCVMVFAVSSFLCGLAPNLVALVVFRIIQGIGGGGLQPTSQAILVETFPRHKRGMAMAVYGITVVAAPIIGPTLGGWITDNYNWRWIFLINIPVGALSLFLTQRLVEDPPYLVRKTPRTGLKIDFIGISLLSVGLGFLQIMLDKGQREDWFESRFIVISAMIAVLGIGGAVIWELRQKEPAVDFRLLGERNFGVANLMMFMLGFVLFGSTVLLPLMLQTLLGYSAVQSGMALSPGGMVVMLMMPVVGFLISRVDARWLVAFGLIASTYGLERMAHFSLGIDFRTAMVARMVQSFGMSFLFVPINTSAYHFLPKEKANSATGLINLARNLGASVGIAVVATLLERRGQMHHNVLVGHLTSYDWNYRTALQGISRTLIQHGSSAADAASQSQAVISGIVRRQASMLAFVDGFRLLAFGFLIMLPFVLLMKQVRPGKDQTVGH